MLSRPLERTSSQQTMTSSLSDQALVPPQKTSGTGRSPSLGRPKTSQYTLSCTSKFNTIAHSSTHSAHTVHTNVCISISTDSSEDDEAVAPTLRPVLETSQPSERLANSTPEEPRPRSKLKGTSHPGPLPTSSSLSRAPTFPAIICATRSRPIIQLPTDSEDEETIVSTFPPRSNPPPDSTHKESCTHGGHVTESVVQTSTLDPSLAEIQPDDSDLEPSGTFIITYSSMKDSPFVFSFQHTQETHLR